MESRLSFWVPLAIYEAIGWSLVFQHRSSNGDAVARLGNAYYVFFSRDPHLAAIGFVWNPLSSVSVMPLLPFKYLWPDLTRLAFAGNITSAVFMAGSVWLVRAILADSGVRRGVRVVLVVLFMVQPMIMYYAGTGMTEGLFIFLLLLTTRYLSRWLARGALMPLVLAASALGLAYLARNEAAFAAAFGSTVVVIVSAARTDGPLRHRVQTAVAEALIFALPFTVCFVGWAVVSWVIVGHPFEQFQSIYGTAAQLKLLTGLTQGQAVKSAPLFAVLEVATLAPLLPVIVTLAAAFAIRRRDPRALAPLTVLGGVLAFAIIAFSLGQTAGWYRYYITAVPLVILLVGGLFADGRKLFEITLPRLVAPMRSLLPWIATAGAIALIAPAIPSQLGAMRNPTIGREESLHLDYFLFPSTKNASLRDPESAQDVKTIVEAIDNMHLRSGSILVDTADGCIPSIVLGSKHPKTFVITNDRDFDAANSDPLTFRVPYIMVSNAEAIDVVNQLHPEALTLRTGITSPDYSLVQRFPGTGGCGEWDLVQVKNPAPA